MSGELVPSRLILSASGKVDPDDVLKVAERLFGDMENLPGTPIGSAEFTGGLRNDRREFEQAHWCLGLPGLPASDPRMPALAVFVQALGGGTSSRLFQELREERGLAYSIGAWQQAFADTGLVDDRLRGGQDARGRIDEPRSRGPRRHDRDAHRRRSAPRAGADGSGLADGAGNAAGPRRPDGPLDRGVRAHRPLRGAARRAARGRRPTSAKAAGAALLDGRTAISSVGARLAAVA